MLANWYPPGDPEKGAADMSSTVRVIIALAVGALALAFAASLTLVAASSSQSTSSQPLVVYGSR
jgi:hypothetical protein